MTTPSRKERAEALAQRINDRLGYRGAGPQYDPDTPGLNGYSGEIVLTPRAAEDLLKPKPASCSALRATCAADGGEA